VGTAVALGLPDGAMWPTHNVGCVGHNASDHPPSKCRSHRIRRLNATHRNVVALRTTWRVAARCQIRCERCLTPPQIKTWPYSLKASPAHRLCLEPVTPGLMFHYNQQMAPQPFHIGLLPILYSFFCYIVGYRLGLELVLGLHCLQYIILLLRP